MHLTAAERSATIMWKVFARELGRRGPSTACSKSKRVRSKPAAHDFLLMNQISAMGSTEAHRAANALPGAPVLLERASGHVRPVP